MAFGKLLIWCSCTRICSAGVAAAAAVIAAMDDDGDGPVPVGVALLLMLRAGSVDTCGDGSLAEECGEGLRFELLNGPPPLLLAVLRLMLLVRC